MLIYAWMWQNHWKFRWQYKKEKKENLNDIPENHWNIHILVDGKLYEIQVSKFSWCYILSESFVVYKADT